jgi:DNA mismatch repair protein MutS
LDEDEKKKVLAMLLEYLESLNISVNILKIKYEEKQDYIYFDSLTIKNLEVLQSNYDQDKKHSLFAILDKTITGVGSRILKNWLLHPLKNIQEIKRRYEGFEYFINFAQSTPGSKLKEIYDIERLYYLIQYKQNSPFHWLKLKISLNAIYEISKIDDKYLSLTEDIDNLRKTLNE